MDFNINKDFNIYIKININLVNYNLYQIILFLGLKIIANIFFSI